MKNLIWISVKKLLLKWIKKHNVFASFSGMLKFWEYLGYIHLYQHLSLYCRYLWIIKIACTLFYKKGPTMNRVMVAKGVGRVEGLLWWYFSALWLTILIIDSQEAIYKQSQDNPINEKIHKLPENYFTKSNMFFFCFFFHSRLCVIHLRIKIVNKKSLAFMLHTNRWI